MSKHRKLKVHRQEDRCTRRVSAICTRVKLRTHENPMRKSRRTMKPTHIRICVSCGQNHGRGGATKWAVNASCRLPPKAVSISSSDLRPKINATRSDCRKRMMADCCHDKQLSRVFCWLYASRKSQRGDHWALFSVASANGSALKVDWPTKKTSSILALRIRLNNKLS